MKLVELFFPVKDEGLSDILVAGLSDIGFNSFWQENDGLRAYIPECQLDEEKVFQLLSDFDLGEKIVFTVGIINPGNWSRGEEDTFEPVIVGGEVLVRQSTSDPNPKIPFEIIVDPNLAFGSGSHPSTLLCIELMLEMDFKGKSVADAGTGTGILAVLAEKMGAARIFAFDNNSWALEVATKTLELNACWIVEIAEGDIHNYVSKLRESAIILANMNIEVFREDYSLLADSISSNNLLLVSGIMNKDENELCELLQENGLTILKRKYLHEWVAILFVRK